MTETQPVNCSKCGRARQTEIAGSITQWITRCQCGETFSADEDYNDSIELCEVCGKRIASGRSGSLTQWVLRSDNCHCDIPQPVPHRERPTEEQHEIEPKEEVELELNPETFPLDRYKPLEEIGKGAAGIVYLCRDRLLHKKVAVKCLRQITPDQLVSFQREAKATSQLQHPCVVKVLDFGGTESGAPYMVMEYVPGISLEQYIERFGAMDWKSAIPEFMRLAESLEYAHDKGIFHRDIKCSNILLSGENFDSPGTRLIDFGVAAVKHATQEPTIVMGNTIVGTPSYMPPDQARGLPYDARSEMYALGCALFKALTGRAPFVADTALELIRKHAEETPPTLAEANPNIVYPDNLEIIVGKCLAKDPDDRFSTMRQLRDALGTLDDDVTAVDVNAQTAAKNNSLTWAVAIAVVLLVVSLVVINSAKRPEPEKAKIESPVKPFSQLFGYSRGDFLMHADRLHVNPIDSSECCDEDLKCFTNFIPKTFNFNFSHTKLSGEGIKYLRQQPKVSIDVSGTNLEDAGFRIMGMMPNLIGVGLAKTAVTDEQLELLCDQPHINELDLANCQHVGKRGFEAVARMPLRTISLRENPHTDEAIEPLSKCKSIRIINLEGTNVTDAQFKKLIAGKRMHEVNVTRCRAITGDSLKFLVEENPALQIAVFADTSLKPEDVRYFAKCKDLLHISVQGVPIGEEQLKVFGQLPTLGYLYMSGLQCDEKALKYLYPLKRMSILGIYGNSKVSQKALNELGQQLPNATIFSSDTVNKNATPDVQKVLDLFLESGDKK